MGKYFPLNPFSIKTHFFRRWVNPFIYRPKQQNIAKKCVNLRKKFIEVYNKIIPGSGV